MKKKLSTPFRNSLLAIACCAPALLAANNTSADVILDFEFNAGDFVPGAVPGVSQTALYILEELNDDGSRTPISLEASTDYTINVSFAGNQALQVLASEQSAFEDVALLFTIPESTTPGSASGMATLHGLGGHYRGSNPWELSSFVFPGFDTFRFFVLGAEQDLTDTSFLFTGVSFQFTTSFDMEGFLPVFSAVQVGGGGFEVVSVSEPGTLALLGIGVFAAGLTRRRRAS